MIDDLVAYLSHDQQLRALDPESPYAAAKRELKMALALHLTPQEGEIAWEMMARRDRSESQSATIRRLTAENEALRAELDKMKAVLQEAADDCGNLLRRLGVDDSDDGEG
jgi:predicted RNase H-like nuclease (RuvC/YqgF family)